MNMNNKEHTVVTKDYAENLIGGIMICGINFGHSAQDEAREKSGCPSIPDLPSFFSDKAVNNTRFRNKILTWLSSWGFEFCAEAGKEGEFERAFFQTNWLDTQTRSIASDGPITIDVLVREADSFLNLLEKRRPSVIMFIGAQMIEALNDIRIRQRVVSILGERSGNAKIHRAELRDYKGIKFKLLAQKFGDTQIISLPHPQSRGISDAYIAGLKPPIHVIHKIIDRKIQSRKNNGV